MREPFAVLATWDELVCVATVREDRPIHATDSRVLWIGR